MNEHIFKALSFGKSTSRSIFVLSTAFTARLPFNFSNPPFTFRSSKICLENTYCVITRWVIRFQFCHIIENSIEVTLLFLVLCGNFYTAMGIIITYGEFQRKKVFGYEKKHYLDAKNSKNDLITIPVMW